MIIKSNSFKYVPRFLIINKLMIMNKILTQGSSISDGFYQLILVPQWRQ